MNTYDAYRHNYYYDDDANVNNATSSAGGGWYPYVDAAGAAAADAVFRLLQDDGGGGDNSTNATSATESTTTNDAQVLRATFVVYGPIFLISLLFFALARRCSPKPYTLRTWVDDLKVGKRTQVPRAEIDRGSADCARYERFLNSNISKWPPSLPARPPSSLLST